MMQFSPGSKVETKHLSYVVLPFFPSIVLLIDSQLYESIIFFALTVAKLGITVNPIQMSSNQHSFPL